MKLSLKFLQEKSACYDGLKWYTENGKINTVEKCVTALIADTDCSEHLNYANWLLSNTLSPDNKIRYAIFAAEQVLELFENATPGDLRPRKAIEAAKEYLKTKTAAAGDAAGAAGDAARAAWAAGYVAGAAMDAARAAWAAWAAGYVAGAAGDAARAAWAAAWAAAGAALAAGDAAWAAARAALAAGDAARAAGDAAYNQMLEKIINYGLSILEAS
jgi:hypothetical protein